MDYSQLAFEYIQDHTNPIKRVTHFDRKLFLESLDENRKECLNKCLNDIQSILSLKRVDRRVGRSVAKWSPIDKIAKVTKITATLKDFGIQNKDGKFLKAEECLFLLEMNKLELSSNDQQISVEEMLGNVEDFNHYLIFRKLILQNFKLCKENRQSEESAPKRIKLEENPILVRLKEKGPKSVGNNDENKCDFFVRKNNQEMGLRIIKSDVFDSRQINEKPNIFAFAQEVEFPFYKFHEIRIQ